MRKILLAFAIFCSLGFSGVFAASGESTVTDSTVQTVEKKRAIEDVNTLIIDSYRVQLDRILKELYENINEATNGNVQAQIDILDKVRDDLDGRLDIIADKKISENRKKILTGVYFYLKSRIEVYIASLKTGD